jgi:hypothetical protein
VAPAATRSLGKFIALGQKGTALVGANALAAGTVNTALTMAGGGDGLEAFAGGFVGSIGGTAASQALGPLAENPIANTAVAGGVGAGTAALIGADPKAGFVGGIASGFGEAAKTGGPGTPHGTDVAEATVAGEKTAASAEPPMRVSAEPTERAVETEPAGRVNEPEPAGPVSEPEQPPAQAGSQAVPLRSDYTPPSEESFGGSASRPRPGRARQCQGSPAPSWRASASAREAAVVCEQ